MYFKTACNKLLINDIGGFWYEGCDLKYRASMAKYLNRLIRSFLKNQSRSGCLIPLHFPEIGNSLFLNWLYFAWRRLETVINVEPQLRLDSSLKTPQEVTSGPVQKLSTSPALQELVPNSPGYFSIPSLRQL